MMTDDIDAALVAAIGALEKARAELQRAQVPPQDRWIGRREIRAKYKRGRCAVKTAMDAGLLGEEREGARKERLVLESAVDRWAASTPGRTEPATVEIDEAEQQLQRLMRGAA